MAPKSVWRSGAGRQGPESALFPQTALGRMASGMPAAFPGAAGGPLQGAGGSGLGTGGGPALGRYNSVLNDGLFNSLQVSCAVSVLTVSFVQSTNTCLSFLGVRCIQPLVAPSMRSCIPAMTCNSNNDGRAQKCLQSVARENLDADLLSMLSNRV